MAAYQAFLLARLQPKGSEGLPIAFWGTLLVRALYYGFVCVVP